MQGILPSTYRQRTGLVSKSNSSSESLPLTLDQKTLPFYETLLNMWIITGRRVSCQLHISQAVDLKLSVLLSDLPVHCTFPGFLGWCDAI